MYIIFKMQLGDILQENVHVWTFFAGLLFIRLFEYNIYIYTIIYSIYIFYVI